MQVADVVFPALDIPERAMRYMLAGALLGFRIAVVLGWFYEVGAHGVRRTGPAGPGERDAAQALRRPDYLILVALAGIAATILYGTVSSVVEMPGQAYRERTEGPPMVAVLPLVSKSLDGEGEFFAVGVHDDLLTQLAQLQSIRVISRTSVLEYKNSEKNIRDIGLELGADAILEGGIQKSGDRIRINAKLIDARTDEHLWSHTYDRVLSPADIFDVQADIARAISTAMNAERFMQQGMRAMAEDQAGIALFRQWGCWIFGIAKATDAAVKCIRDALIEPRNVMPFLEPFFPFYDPIRAEPEFIGLLTDLDLASAEDTNAL